MQIIGKNKGGHLNDRQTDNQREIDMDSQTDR